MLAHHFAGKFFIYCGLISYLYFKLCEIKETKKFIHNEVALAWFFPVYITRELGEINQPEKSTKEIQLSSSDPATWDDF